MISTIDEVKESQKLMLMYIIYILVYYILYMMVPSNDNHTDV